MLYLHGSLSEGEVALIVLLEKMILMLMKNNDIIAALQIRK